MNRREFLKLSAASPIAAAGAIKEMRAEPKSVQDHGYSYIFLEDSID